MAHDKSKFFFFRPEIELWQDFFLEIRFNPAKPLRPYVFVIYNQNGCDSYLLGNFALYILHRTKPGFEPRN